MNSCRFSLAAGDNQTSELSFTHPLPLTAASLRHLFFPFGSTVLCTVPWRPAGSEIAMDMMQVLSSSRTKPGPAIIPPLNCFIFLSVTIVYFCPSQIKPDPQNPMNSFSRRGSEETRRQIGVRLKIGP